MHKIDFGPLILPVVPKEKWEKKFPPWVEVSVEEKNSTKPSFFKLESLPHQKEICWGKGRGKH